MNEKTLVGEIIEGSDDSFETDVVECDKLVLVDFWAPWCGPCKAIAPLLEEIVEEHNIRVVKINVDNNQKMAQVHEVRAIPTLLVFNNGELQSKKIGAIQKSELVEMIAN